MKRRRVKGGRGEGVEGKETSDGRGEGQEKGVGVGHCTITIGWYAGVEVHTLYSIAR